jgi:hypothetical protein
MDRWIRRLMGMESRRHQPDNDDARGVAIQSDGKIVTGSSDGDSNATLRGAV